MKTTKTLRFPEEYVQPRWQGQAERLNGEIYNAKRTLEAVAWLANGKMLSDDEAYDILQRVGISKAERV